MATANTCAVGTVVATLVVTTPPKNREEEARKARERARERFAP